MQVVVFARIYNRNPLEALVESGYIDRNESFIKNLSHTHLRDVALVDLIEEVRSRIEATGYFMNLLQSSFENCADPAHISESALLTIHPFMKPAEVDIEPFIEALGPNKKIESHKGETFYGITGLEE